VIAAEGGVGKMVAKELTMIELTEQQRQTLNDIAHQTAIVETNSAYLLVRKDLIARLKDALDLGDFDPDEGLAYINEIMAEDDANDPHLAQYQHFRKAP
jgi:hypothetical protein